MSANQAAHGEDEMRHFADRISASILTGTVLLGGMARPTQAEPRDSQPAIVLRVLNTTGVSAPVLAEAKDHVQRIYENIGIEMVWLDTDAVPPSATTDDAIGSNALPLTVVMAHSDTAGNTYKAAVTGIALSSNGEGIRRAYVFSDRAEEQANVACRRVSFLTQPRSEALILGHVIAHEVGHLMLPGDSHGPTGIMKGQMDARSISDAAEGRLSFTDEEGELIRRAHGRQVARQ